MKYLTLVFFFLISLSAFAQNHILEYEFNVEDTVINRLDPGTPTKSADAFKVKKNMNDLNLRFQTLMIDSVMVLLSKAGYSVSSNDALKDYIKVASESKVSLLGGPKGIIKKLNKKGYAAEHYITIKAKLMLGALGMNTKGIKPVIEYKLMVWDGEGNVVKKLVHKERASGGLLAKIDKDNHHIKFIQTEKAEGFSTKFVKFDKTKVPFMDLLFETIRPLTLSGLGIIVGKIKS